MKVMPLTKGKFAIVDDKDFEWLSQWKWSLAASGNHARRNVTHNGKQKTIFMHQEILGIKEGFYTDHINCNGLDNRKENLRFATKSQNSMNRNHKCRGVYRRKINGRYRVYIRVKGKSKYLGDYATQEDGLKVRREAEKTYYKEYAYAGN